MSDHHKKEIDTHSGMETTGQEWDGIKELNTPLPRWWLIVWYASIVFSIVYWVLMPAWPAPPGMQGSTAGILNYSDRSAVAMEMAKLKDERAALNQRLDAASLQEIVDDPELLQYAQAAGISAFGDNCATCHGQGGRGGPGYPVLADDVWLWGGTLDDIEYTLVHGIRAENNETRYSAMPAFGRDGLLQPEQITDVTSYVLTLSGWPADASSATRGAEVFELNCASCHGADGKGDRVQGAPNLTDTDWLYVVPSEDSEQAGEQIATMIYNQVYDSRNSQMPSWSDRLDPATIKALAVYVWSLGGGEES